MRSHRLGTGARLLGALLVASSSFGCSVFDPALIEAAEDAGPDDDRDGGGGGDVDLGPQGIGCTMGRRVAPARPPASTEGEDLEEIVFGLKEVLLDQPDPVWQDIGLDLDGYCSDLPVPVGECVPPSDTATLIADGDQGIDNAFGAELYPLVELVFPDLQATVRTSSEQGLGVVAIRLRGYNGQADDPRVDATLSQSTTAFAGSADEQEPPSYTIVDYRPFEADMTTPMAPPAWDGNDWLVLREDTFFSGDLEQPLVRDSNAYVVGRTLVMTLPARVDIVFAGPDNGITVRLTDARAIGTLSEDLTRLENVTFAGRWPVIDLLRTTESLGVCEGDPEFDIFRRKLDSAADIRTTPGTGGEGAECDALSVGVKFEGYRSRIAGLTPGRIPPMGCL